MPFGVGKTDNLSSRRQVIGSGSAAGIVLDGLESSRARVPMTLLESVLFMLVNVSSLLLCLK